MLLNSEFIDETVKRIVNAMPPGARRLQEDLEKNLRAALSAAFARLDLVSREEFEVQCGVLQRTRQRLEALERRIDELESRTASEEPPTTR